MKDSFRRGATAAIAVAIAAASLAAQPATQRSIPQTYAITNARIVPVSSPVIEKGTIVIRDGLISAVGANVSAPGDARIHRRVPGLTVYPGLIDSYTALGLGESAGGGAAKRAADAEGARLRQLARLLRRALRRCRTIRRGLQPGEQRRRTAQGRSRRIFTAYPQSVGITTARFTAPPTGIYIGQSALINLGAAVMRLRWS